jgi:excisionase family DNA binding protein
MTKPAKPSQGPKYRRLQYVADKLDLSPRSVQRLIASGELPAFKIRGAVRVSDDDIERLIARSRLSTAADE